MSHLFRCAGMGKRFGSLTDPLLVEQVSKARHRVYEMEKTERAAGGEPPEDADLDMHARTAISAFEAGLPKGGRPPDWDCLFDAYVMLQDVERRIRTIMELDRRVDDRLEALPDQERRIIAAFQEWWEREGKAIDNQQAAQ